MRQILLFAILFSHLSRAFESPEATGLDAVLHGKIRSAATDELTLKREIRAQLRYLVGQLFNLGSPGGFSFEIGIQSQVGQEVYYETRFLFAWTSHSLFPSSYSVVVPARGDSSSLASFDRNYLKRCGDSGSPLWYGMWYANDPQCPLASDPPPSNAFRFSLDFSRSGKNSTSKSPDYEKIWEDGKLVVTLVGGNTESRAGQVHELLNQFEQSYGPPLSFQKTETASLLTVQGSYQTFAGPLEFRGLDIKKGTIQNTDTAFREKLGSFSEDSDLVAYNGHSDHGKNISAFTSMVRFKKNQYALYWVNACKPFAHLDETLFEKVRAVNPLDLPSRFLDLMAVVNLGDFGASSDTHQLVYRLLQKKNFRDLLTWVSSGQPAVVGDEDNATLL